MDPERAARAANNKSLRIIKNELEALAERGFITDAQFDTITSALPAEQSLSSVRSPNPTPTATPQQNNNPYQAPHQAPTPQPQHNSNPIPQLGGMHLHQQHDATSAPPSYQQAVPMPPPRQAPAHKEVGHAVALWAYNTPDQRDLNFAAGDHISVLEFVNPEWWMGKNCRTGEEGIFPSNYVRSENYPSPLMQGGQGAPSPAGYYGNEKAAGGYPGQHEQQQPYQPYQAQQDPYKSHVPPVAIANPEPQHNQEEGDGKGGKAQEMGKKFGKKLGNAAIFGAGATIGGNIVNSIF